MRESLVRESLVRKSLVRESDGVVRESRVHVVRESALLVCESAFFARESVSNRFRRQSRRRHSHRPKWKASSLA